MPQVKHHFNVYIGESTGGYVSSSKLRFLEVAIKSAIKEGFVTKETVEVTFVETFDADKEK